MNVTHKPFVHFVCVPISPISQSRSLPLIVLFSLTTRGLFPCQTLSIEVARGTVIERLNHAITFYPHLYQSSIKVCYCWGVRDSTIGTESCHYPLPYHCKRSIEVCFCSGVRDSNRGDGTLSLPITVPY